MCARQQRADDRFALCQHGGDIVAVGEAPAGPAGHDQRVGQYDAASIEREQTAVEQRGDGWVVLQKGLPVAPAKHRDLVYRLLEPDR